MLQWGLHHSNPLLPLFYKRAGTGGGGGGGVIDFLEFGNKCGDEIFFLEREELD